MDKQNLRIEAAQRGESKYLGKACKTCGNEVRYVMNSTCVQCHRKAARESVAAFRDRLRQIKAGAV